MARHIHIHVRDVLAGGPTAKPATKPQAAPAKPRDMRDSNPCKCKAHANSPSKGT